MRQNYQDGVALITCGAERYILQSSDSGSEKKHIHTQYKYVNTIPKEQTTKIHN